MRIAVILLFVTVTVASCNEKEALFDVVSSEKSGITFSNSIAENSMINMLNYEYLYNGGGVGRELGPEPIAQRGDGAFHPRTSVRSAV